MEDDPVGAHRLREDSQKLLSVDIILENGLPVIATVGDVVQSAWILNSQWSGHVIAIEKRSGYVKEKDLTPYSVDPIFRQDMSRKKI
jgi:hypothetical protein